MYEVYRKLRDEAGENDYQVAKATGIDSATLSAWKAGRYTPKIDKLKKIADHFSVSIEVFIPEA